jgi:hypothetical protein
MFEYGLSGKWLELLKQIAPSITRAAVVRGSGRRLRDRAVRRCPGGGAVLGSGVDPGRRARCARNRASAHALAGEREKAIATGCEELDTKPIEFDRARRHGIRTLGLNGYSIALLDAVAIATPVELTVILGRAHERRAGMGIRAALHLRLAAGHVLLGLALACASLPAEAQQWTPQQRAACEPDAMRLCNQYVPDVQRVSTCMSHYRRYLSPACRVVFQGGAKKRVRRFYR